MPVPDIAIWLIKRGIGKAGAEEKQRVEERRRRVEEGDGLARTGDEVVGIYAQLGTSTRIVCFLRALVSRWIGSTRIVCFLRALASRLIGSTRIVCFLRALVSRLIGSTRIVCFFRALVSRWTSDVV